MALMELIVVALVVLLLCYLAIRLLNVEPAVVLIIALILVLLYFANTGHIEGT